MSRGKRPGAHGVGGRDQTTRRFNANLAIVSRQMLGEGTTEAMNEYYLAVAMGHGRPLLTKLPHPEHLRCLQCRRVDGSDQEGDDDSDADELVERASATHDRDDASTSATDAHGDDEYSHSDEYECTADRKFASHRWCWKTRGDAESTPEQVQWAVTQWRQNAHGMPVTQLALQADITQTLALEGAGHDQPALSTPMASIMLRRALEYAQGMASLPEAPSSSAPAATGAVTPGEVIDADFTEHALAPAPASDDGEK